MSTITDSPPYVGSGFYRCPLCKTLVYGECLCSTKCADCKSPMYECRCGEETNDAE